MSWARVALREAEAQLRAGRLAKARRGGLAAAEDPSCRVPALVLLGRVAALQGRNAEAVEAYRQCLGAGAKDVSIRASLATALLEEDDAEAAVAEFRAALDGDLSDEAVRRRLGEALSDVGRHAEALTVLGGLTGPTVQDRVLIARCRLGAGDRDGALDAFSAVEAEAVAAIRSRLGNRAPAAPADQPPVAIHRTARFSPAAGQGVVAAGPEGHYALRFEDCVLLSGEWLLIDRDGRLYLDLLYHRPGGKASRYLALPTADMAGVRMPARVETIDEPALFVGGADNYYHWTIDFLPRLSAADWVPDGDGLHLVTSGAKTAFERRAFELLGVSPDRLLGCAYPGAYRFRDLIVPVMETRPFQPGGVPEPWRSMADPARLAWLGDRFSPWFGKGGGRRLFVSRGDSGQRRLVNEAAVVAALDGLNFETVRLGGLALEDQIALFSEAEIVVAPHGAALSNLVFAPDDVRVVEIVPHFRPPPFFTAISRLRGIRHQCVFGDLVLPKDPSLDRRFWDFEVDVEAVKAAVETITEGSPLLEGES